MAHHRVNAMRECHEAVQRVAVIVGVRGQCHEKIVYSLKVTTDLEGNRNVNDQKGLNGLS